MGISIDLSLNDRGVDKESIFFSSLWAQEIDLSLMDLFTDFIVLRSLKGPFQIERDIFIYIMKLVFAEPIAITICYLLLAGATPLLTPISRLEPD